MPRFVKDEPEDTANSSRRRATVNGEAATSDLGHEGSTERRVLLTRYHTVKNLISDKRDDISRADSDNFSTIIKEVESLHELVQKPREQVADAEVLLDITNTLVTSVKAHGDEGVTPSDFVSSLLRDFGQQYAASSSVEDARSSIVWRDIGLAVSHVFRMGSGCFTMLGPMNTELKQRKAVVHRKRVKPTESSCPEELDDNVGEDRTDTDKNMSIMFDTLRMNRRVKLENLVLNRNSFSQTVENLFALSFLVKDGRAEIITNEKGCQLVSPRNAPSANAVASREVSYSHFVFRFDFKDWKLMKDLVRIGEELMPHRNQTDVLSTSQNDLELGESLAAGPTTPIRKLTRNRGLVLQEQSVVEDSPESDYNTARTAAIGKRERRLM